MRFFPATLLPLALLLLAPNGAAAQEDLFDLAGNGEARAEEEYHSSLRAPTPRQIIQQKAQIRAVQRMNRMAALEWYGYSKARPRTTTTPFTGLYGSQWQSRSLGRPAAWYASRPTVIITQ